MADLHFDILGIGNAIVDVIARTDEAFLEAHRLQRGSMSLVDEQRSADLYAKIGPTLIVSGGSAANTIVGAASLGAEAAFIGKVKADPMGEAFAHDIRAVGVHFETPFAAEGPSTANCIVLVTPDGERTMNTYLGASQNLTAADVDEAVVRAADITYLEGYLWDPPSAKDAFRRASGIAHSAGRRVALTLSDAFCVDRFRSEFLDLIRSGSIDIVFANQHELKSLYETADFNSALAALREEGILGVVTRSEHGSVVVTREETHAVAAFPIATLIDTTGAGDLFAAGFLTGLVRGADLVTCARLGALAAAEVIQHIGARPQSNLADLAAENGLAPERSE